MSKPYPNFIHFASIDATFCYVPKVACSNWKCIARRILGNENWLDTTLAHDRKRSGLTFLDPSKPPDLKRLSSCGLNLAMVRNPYSRILSAYLNKIARNFGANPSKEDFWTLVTKKIYKNIDISQSNPLNKREGFAVFLDWLLKSDDFERFDEHWAPQWSIMRPDLVRFHQTERFENLPYSGEKLMSMLGCDFEFPTQKKINFSGMNTLEKIDQYYSETSISQVNHLYGEDFNNFGYAAIASIEELKAGLLVNG